MRKLSAAATLSATLLIGACADDAPVTQPTSPLTSSLSMSNAPDRPVYIVTFRDDVSDVQGLARQLSAAHGSAPRFTYETVLRGFAAPFSEQAADALLRNPKVASVERDMVVAIDATTQNNATWGLDRIDQRTGLNSSYSYDATGAGVTAYIIDTGILPTHEDFGGRVRNGYTAIGDGNGTSDCNGHGTHVAGTVGGTVHGVAKAVALVPVRVMDCGGSGYTSSVIAGIDWVARNASGPSVANMSIGGGADGMMDKAIANAVAKGITFVVAAGNSGANACDYSPSRATVAITVGATSGDSRAGYSNYGSCVDVFAPGTSITSTWSSGNTAVATISGTSMASPHVAGVAALYLEANRSASPAAVAQAIADNATMDVVSDAGTGSPNRHVFMGFITGGGGGSGDLGTPVDAAPTANFSVSCSGLTCSFNGGASTDDGSIAGYSWSFGDGSIASGSSVSRSYLSAGNYQVTLVVTDNTGKTGSLTKTASPSAPVPVDLMLSARVVRKGANRMVQLSWTGASSVEVKRDGAFVTVANGTSYQDNRGKNAGSATYVVCTGGSCSNSVIVSY